MVRDHKMLKSSKRYIKLIEATRSKARIASHLLMSDVDSSSEESTSDINTLEGQESSHPNNEQPQSEMDDEPPDVYQNEPEEFEDAARQSAEGTVSVTDGFIQYLTNPLGLGKSLKNAMQQRQHVQKIIDTIPAIRYNTFVA